METKRAKFKDEIKISVKKLCEPHLVIVIIYEEDIMVGRFR